MTRTFLMGLAGALVVASGAEARAICTAVADAGAGRLLVADGDCSREVTPASTFKIAISLMGYDAGVLRSEHDPILPFKPGYVDWRPSWRQPTDPARWMQESVVWYSQQTTQAIGAQKFAAYVSRFDYGNHDISGDVGQNNGLTAAWLSSSLRISPLGQLQFLRKVVNRSLPVSPKAFAMTDAITKVEGDFGGWDVHGKTGAGTPDVYLRGTEGRWPYGWFVGWATKGDKKVVFARLIQDEAAEATAPGLRARDSLLAELPALLAKAN